MTKPVLEVGSLLKGGFASAKTGLVFGTHVGDQHGSGDGSMLVGAGRRGQKGVTYAASNVSSTVSAYRTDSRAVTGWELDSPKHGG